MERIIYAYEKMEDFTKKKENFSDFTRNKDKQNMENIS
jgi:hypothetical protein